MDQKALRTSWKQRIIIILIAIFMLGSTLATYIAVVIVNSRNKSSDEASPELTKLEEEYSAKQTEINEYSSEIAKKYLDELKSYKSSNVKSYNAETVNKDGLTTKDLKKGDGKKLAEGDTDYFAYYVGWCPDESIFDSSFDDAENPTTLNAPLSASIGLIEGWNQGVVGMHLGGVRELSIPGELAYGETQEICGSKNSPLKFIVMPIEDEKLSKLNEELEDTYNKMMEQYSK